MVYLVEFSKDADRTFNKLDRFLQERIAKKLKELETNPELGKPVIKSETFNTMDSLRRQSQGPQNRRQRLAAARHRRDALNGITSV